MSTHAVTFAIVAMVAWGVWTILANEATGFIRPELAMILSYGSAVIVAVGYVLARGEPIALDRTGTLLALAAGVFAGIGAVAFYVGLSAGRASMVTTVSALYFVVAVVLGVLVLGESLAPKDALGIAFAVAAVVLISQ